MSGKPGGGRKRKPISISRNTNGLPPELVLYTLPEVCVILNLQVVAVRNKIKRGYLRASYNGEYRVSQKELLAYLERNATTDVGVEEVRSKSSKKKIERRGKRKEIKPVDEEED